MTRMVRRNLNDIPEWAKSKWIIGGGALVLLFIYRRLTTRIAVDVVKDETEIVPGNRSIDPFYTWQLSANEARAFEMALPDAGKEYANIFVQVAKEYQISPFLLAGFMEVETYYGKTKVCRGAGPKCIGSPNSSKPDYGLMQINGKAHPDFMRRTLPDGTPAWQSPLESVRYGAKYIKYLFNYFSSPGKGAVKVGGYVAYRCATFPGKRDNPLPVTDKSFLALTVAASYNAGEGNGIQALAADCSPDAVTFKPGYGKSVVTAAARIGKATAAYLSAGGAS